MLRLYYAQNTCALASHIVLEQIGAPYEAVRISFAQNEQRSADYLAINPKARVPALITPRGVLTETPAILAFLAQSYPEAKLAPLDDAFAFARVQEFSSYLCSTVHVAHAHRMRGYRWASDETSFDDMRRMVPQSVLAAFAIIDRDLSGPWVLGDTYSICDPYLFTLAQWLEQDGVDPAAIPRVAAHRERMRDLPAVKAALAAEFA
jgi:glutathione S-transferase